MENSIPEISVLRDLPRAGGEPVFSEPWQAQAFALVVNLQQLGVFSWDEWASELGQSIEQARQQGDPDLGDTYYNHWLVALESITEKKGLVAPELLSSRKQEVLEAHEKLHGHSH